MDCKQINMMRGFVTEQLTNEEIGSLDDAIELYLNGFVDQSDYVIATEINKNSWVAVANYMTELEEDGENDAEQDY